MFRIRLLISGGIRCDEVLDLLYFVDVVGVCTYGVRVCLDTTTVLKYIRYTGERSLSRDRSCHRALSPGARTYSAQETHLPH